MTMILAAAATAMAALYSYRRSEAHSAGLTEERVNNIRQATSVILAVAEAVWAILDALVGLRSSGKRNVKSTTVPGDGAGLRRTWGTNLASDVD